MLNDLQVAHELDLTVWISQKCDSEKPVIRLVLPRVSVGKNSKESQFIENIKQYIEFLNYTYCVDEISDLVLDSKLKEACDGDDSTLIISFGVGQNFRGEHFVYYPNVSEVMQSPMIKKQVFLDVRNSI